MKTRLRFNLSLAVMKLFLMFGVIWLLVLGGNVLAVPIAVDIYQDMESGNAGDVLTGSIMNASSHGSQGWSMSTTGQQQLWVSTLYHKDLPGPVIVGGVTTYNGTGGTRTWSCLNDNLANFVRLDTSSHTNITLACYYTTLSTLTKQAGYDTLIMWGGSTFACMQTLGGPLVGSHAKTGDGCSTGGLSDVSITVGKPYWINMKYDGTVAEVFLAVFDPDASYAQVGATVICQATYNDGVAGTNYFGRGDNHGNQSNDMTYSYYDQIMFDYTNAAFPLLLCGPNDSTAPSAPPVVRDGTGQDQSIALSTTQLSANWDMAWDAESGIKGYQYAIGTTQGGTNVVNWTTIKNQLGVTKTGLSLTTGQTYYFSVKAINGVGITGSATNSNGQTVGTDSTPPSTPSAVWDASYHNYTPDIDLFRPASGTMYGNFYPATDNESGISFYQYGIGTTPGATDFVGWTNIPANAFYPNTPNGINAIAGQRYFFTVRAVNNAGLTGPAANSDGQTALNSNDTTPPTAPPAVRDGTGADISTTTSTTQLSANWDRATDSDDGISGYEYSIGTSPGGTNVVNRATISYAGPIGSVTMTGLSLSVGQTYYFSVKAINGKILYSSATNSNGQTVVSGTDSTPPSAPPAVRDGTGTDISTTSSTTQLSANWDASTDNESGISGYQYAIGTSAGGTQSVNWTSLGNVTTVTKSLTLTVGQTYYFSVKAVNGAGLTGSATNSNGQTVVDITAPSAPPTVRDGTGADISTTTSITTLSANWDASTDNESGISGYQYAIGTSAGGTQSVNWTSLGNVTTVTKTGLTLTVGQTYYFSVRAVNGAGLTGSATNSNGQTVVSSAVTYFSDTFDSWAVHGGAWSSVSGESVNHSLNTSTDYARAGTKSLKLTDSDTTATYGACLIKTFSPTISAAIYVRFYVYLPTAYVSANSSAASRRLLRIMCSGQRGQMSLTSGATPLMEEVGGWGGVQASSALSANAWHCIEMYMAAPSASTAMQFWIDGTSAGTLTGNFTGATAYDSIQFGDVCVGGGTNATGTFYLDEVIASDTYNGPLP